MHIYALCIYTHILCIYVHRICVCLWHGPQIVPRQRKCVEALSIVNDTLDELVAKCKALVEEEDEEFVEEFSPRECGGTCVRCDVCGGVVVQCG